MSKYKLKPANSLPYLSNNIQAKNSNTQTIQFYLKWELKNENKMLWMILPQMNTAVIGAFISESHSSSAGILKSV